MQPSVGIKPHIRPHIVQGIGSIWQRFPQTAAELAALIGKTPSNIWRFDAASGNYSDLVGSETLVPLNSPMQGVATPFAGRRAMRTADASTQKAYRADNTKFDYGAATSFAWLVVMSPNTAAGRDLIAKRSGGAAYYRCYATGGVPYASVTDGVNSAYVTLAGAPLDGTLRAYLLVTDRAAQKLRLAASGGLLNEASCSTVGSLSNTGYLSLGSVTGFAAACDYLYCAHFVGAQAEGMGSAEIAKFWRGI